MSRNGIAASTLSAAVGIALGMQLAPAFADDMSADSGKMTKVAQENMERAKANNLEKCFGINALGKNDCAVGSHSCAGQSDKARDPKSFVLIPAGTCSKIAGGKTTAT